jgi:hypothetical protein
VCGVGPHCSFCGTLTGPFSEVEGLFTVLICIPCLEVRQARPDTLLGWTATYELLRPYPNQRQRVVYRRSEPPPS